MSEPSGDVTLLLRRWTDGDPQALDQLVPLVYSELQILAARHLRNERPGQTLQTTALVHEAYLRLAGQQSKEWKNRGHFLAVCSQLLRQVLVDAARTRRAAKRNLGEAPLPLNEDAAIPGARTDAELIALSDSLDSLAKIDPSKARIVELKYFGGFNVEEIAEILGISTPTVKRHWAVAKAWLYKEMEAGEV
jgi:RNA polymerase sigma factor (TIGR02999 family)